MAYDWSTFTQKMRIKAPVADLYELWTTQHGLESWFLRMAEFTRNDEVIAKNTSVHKGDTYRWRWYGYPDEVTETGAVLEANGKDKFSFIFGNAGKVDVTFNEIDDGETEMTIRQYEIPTGEEGKENYHVGCSTGWTFYRCNLKSIVEGGIDIRNKEHNEDYND